jgi:hypothetical protein
MCGDCTTVLKLARSLIEVNEFRSVRDRFEIAFRIVAGIAELAMSVDITRFDNGDCGSSVRVY